ncbi:MAG TPA: M20/M25/M40 family metallo-hydrolase [Gemmatimonadaceae bacterium]|jgi:acetylornithine deacetylase/succinyl-diaminopimelate desuccinylase-like protein
MRLTFPLSVLLTLASVTTLSGQALAVPHDSPRLRAALDTIKAQEPWTIQQQISLCEIPAPPYKEASRAAEYRRRLQALGITNVRIDSMGNVIAERRGTGNGPTVLIEGHLDTVFPEGTEVEVKRNGSMLAGPGIGDDCRGLAVVLSVVRAFQRANVQTVGTVYFVGDVGEEGQGNLRGTRYLFTNTLKSKIDYFISIDGTGLDLKDHGVGSKRYRITYKGPGGHSYGAFGIPNPIHALGRAIAAIGDIQVPTSPKTTFNVGVISGGTSVNSIPFSATMDLDMRSETAEALDAVDKQVLRILTTALDAENDRWIRQTGSRAEKAKLSLEIDTIGIRPANSTQTDSSRIVATAIAAGRALGFTPRTGASSTDANLPMSLGVPAITIDGGGRGTGAHSLGETYDDGATGWLGPQWAALIVAALAGVH